MTTTVERYLETFQAMRSAWHAALARADGRVEASTQERVARWRDELKRMGRQADDLRRAGCWRRGPTDLLGVIGRQRRETVHSATLAWLMDPQGHHGLGTRFLQALLRRSRPPIEWPEESLASARPQCELAHPESRADIVVYAPRPRLVIEAKVDAEEGHRQCLRLYRDFRDYPGVAFIFLTPDGRPPTTDEDESKDRFSCLSLRTVREILSTLVDDLRHRDPPPLALAALDTYLSTLFSEFP